MSSSHLQLRRDYPNGFFGFMDAAEKTYGQQAYEAVEKCTDTVWKATREIFLKDPNLPLYADVAAALERAILGRVTSK